MYGQAILEVIKSHGDDHLGQGMRIVSGEASSYTIILSPPNIDRIFIHCPGPNETFGADDVNYKLVQQADLFHFGYPPLLKRMYQHEGAELVKMFRQAKATGVTTSLDMAMPDPTSPAGRADWSAILKAVLPFVDLFVPNVEEILLLLYPELFKAVSTGATPISPTLVSKIAADLLEMGAKVVMLKAGHLGLYLRTSAETSLAGLGRARPDNLARWANREFWVPVFQTRVVGTTGAGDATVAGFLSALLRNLIPTEAVTLAAAVGACNVEAADALGGLRSWEETRARIEAGWPRQKLNFEDIPGWRFDPTRQLWLGPNDPT
jgi:sugar/nucleoside kinase (ribokinase family)